MPHDEDPVTPSVKFDSYVIPNSVRQNARSGQGHQASDAPRPSLRQPRTPRPRTDQQDRSGGGLIDFSLPGFQLTGLIAAVSGIAFLTFVLGIMVALKFSGSGDSAFAGGKSADVNEAGQDVTRIASPDLTATPPAPASIITPVAAELAAIEPAVPSVLKPVASLPKLTEDEITKRTLKAQAIVNRNKLRMLREGVLAGVYTVKEQEENGVRRLVLNTINAELSRVAMGKLLLEAAQRGDAQIPASLNAASGGYDMDTTLFNLIQTSLMNDGTPEGKEAATEMSRRAFLASTARTQLVNGQRVYTVQRGDSLASIALQFFGMPSAYQRIFEANKTTLSSPDQLQTGQQLIIPL